MFIDKILNLFLKRIDRSVKITGNNSGIIITGDSEIKTPLIQQLNILDLS